MNFSNWLPFDNEFDEYSSKKITRLLQYFLTIISAAALGIGFINYRLGFPLIAATILAVPFFCLLSYWFLRKGLINLAIVFLISILLIANTLSCILGNGIHETGIIVLPVIVLFSSLILNARGVIATTILVIACLALIVFGEKFHLFETRPVPSVRWADLIVVEVILMIHIYVTYTLSQIIKNNLERVKAELAKQEQLREETLQNLEEKSDLLRQVHHRVKNNLLLINSLVDMESYGNPEMKTELTEITDSMNTIARAHDPLYHTEDYKQVELKPYLEKIVGNFLQSNQQTAIKTEIENQLLFHKKALMLGILVQKILAKYALVYTTEVVVRLMQSDEKTLLAFSNHQGISLSDADLQLEQKLLLEIGGQLKIGTTDLTIQIDN